MVLDRIVSALSHRDLEVGDPLESLVGVEEEVRWLIVLSIALETDQTFDNSTRHPIYLQKPGTPDPRGLSRFSVGTSAHAVQSVQHLPSIPELAKVHVLSIKLG